MDCHASPCSSMLGSLKSWQCVDNVSKQNYGNVMASQFVWEWVDTLHRADVLKLGIAVVIGWVVSQIVFRSLSKSVPVTHIQTPCGKIKVFNEAEAHFLSYETFYSESHFRQGISIRRDTPLILDIGANVGFFTRYVKWKWENAIVHAVEPVPETFQLLRENVSGYDNVNLYQYGLSDNGGVSKAQFTVNLGFASGATSTKDIVERATVSGSEKNEGKKAGLLDWIKAFNLDFRKAFNSSEQSPSLLGDVKNWIYTLYHVIPFMVKGNTEVECELVSLQWLLEHKIKTEGQRIDLIKIDVEGAELKVLQGISEDTFNKTDNVVVEVHDENESLEKIKTLLRDRGFRVSVGREDWEFHKFENLYLVYGVKPEHDNSK